MKRRSFLLSSAAAGSLALLNGARFYNTAIPSRTGAAPPFLSTEALEVNRYHLRYPSLHPDLDGFTFAFVSDFHLGGWVRTELVERALAAVHEEKVELLLHGGDYLWVPDSYGPAKSFFFINDSFSGPNDEALAESIYGKLAELSSRYDYPLGTFGVLGNHDRWSNAHACYEYLPQAGISLLENKRAVVQKGAARLEIFGTADYWTGVPELPSFTDDAASFKVLLTHNPDFASYAYHKKRCFFNLALSGHTHGGQVKLPLLGALTYNIEDARYGEGLVDYGETKFFTSRGIGVVEVPVRIYCPPEVSIITLQKA